MEQDVSKVLNGILDELKGIHQAISNSGYSMIEQLNDSNHDAAIMDLTEKIAALTEALKDNSTMSKSRNNEM